MNPGHSLTQDEILFKRSPNLPQNGTENLIKLGDSDSDTCSCSSQIYLGILRVACSNRSVNKGQKEIMGSLEWGRAKRALKGGGLSERTWYKS